MASKVVVHLPDGNTYDVRIGAGIAQNIGQRIASTIPQATAALVLTDSNVGPLYAKQVRESIKAVGLHSTEITIPAGEVSKSIDCIAEVWQAMAQAKFDRNAVVVALGGGVVGDLAGFAAASYMRGVSLVQVPTSLLAMVDSSVGGKTGIDLPQGKNLVGAFKQPEYVCADTTMLETLPQREWVCGCGEIAKAAVIASDDFFFWLSEHAQDLAEYDLDIANEAIVRCVVFKANVVGADPFERSGVRACLNYGHTLGHAIEKLAGFGAYSHGECVAEGMRFAARLGAEMVGTPLELVQAQDELLDNLGLVSLNFAAKPEQILDAMHSDKKSNAGVIKFVLPEDVGKWSLLEVDEANLREHLEAWAQSKEA